MKNTTPAVLLYYQDFLAGCAEMSMEERGAYITLLCYQNAHGHMTRAYINRVCPGCPEYVLSKFVKDDKGNYFNERMEKEILRRVKYKASRAKNLGGENSSGEKHMEPHMESHMDAHMESHMHPHMDSHMETETETETITVTDNKKKASKKAFKPPTVEEVQAYCNERGNTVNAEGFVDFYTSNGWKVGKNPMRDWKAAVRTWEKREEHTPARERPRNEVLEMLQGGLFDE